MVSPLLLSRLSTLRRPSSLLSSSSSKSLPFVGFRSTRHLHIRPISILSGIGRIAGRTAGRGALGLGVGAGALTWAEWKVDGFKQNAVSGLSQINEKLATSFNSVAESLNSTLDNLSNTAGGVWEEASTSLGDRLNAFKSAWRERFSQQGEGEQGEGGEEEPQEPKRRTRTGRGGKEAVTGIATAMAATLPTVVDAEAPPPSEDASEDLMILTRKLIEIRTILLSIGEEAGLTLPSIVVIGSQSSGKSSVLEAIVGREFLPKGDNMVTRRPIELTLVHTPSTRSDPQPSTFAEFPSLGPGHITDFSIVQKTLVDLNLSVPVSDCVSDSPIQLRIHSPHVPDLSLVDLPGYVQIASMDQPEELKEKISKLCEKYIKSPNIILAVCAADVDLANSPALRAAKKVDPLGMRTIGVVTKMDLVEPSQGASILSNNRYPLALGYVGVVCKPSKHYIEIASSRSLLGRATSSFGNTNNEDSGSLVGPIRAQELDFFYSQENSNHFNQEGMLVSTDVLKKRLMHVLEESMASSLHSISNAVALELEEASYQFKVQYNDRQISAESYVAETMDELKKRINQLSKSFQKQDVRKMLKIYLDDQVLDLLASQYWIDSKTPELGKLANDRNLKPEDLDVYWQRKLDHLSSSLTKSGIGRASTQLVVDAIRSRLGTLANEEPLIHHPGAAERINATADSILRERFTLTSDQVENSVKPFKYEVEVEDKEWSDGRERAVELLQKELSMCEGALSKIRDTVGQRKLRGAMEYVGEVEESERRRRERRREARAQGEDWGDEEEAMMSDPTRPAFNPALLAKAREAMFLSSRSSILRLRLLALKSRRCKAGPEQKSFCPEAFLNIVADKLSKSAVQFINIELLVEFFYQFPREIDTRLSGDLDRSEIVAFARENPLVAKHLALQERKQKLELVAEKLDSLVKLQRDKAKLQHDPRRAREGKRGLFGMF